MAKPRFLFLHILDFLESREETAFKQINDELGIPQTILRLTLGDLVEQGLAEKKVRGRRSYYSITDRGRSLGAFHQIESFAGYLDFVVADKDVKAKVLKRIEKINANSSEGEVARWYQGAMGSLSADETISLTYCNCSKGFVKKFWEAVLEKPVQVELMQSVMSGAPNRKFGIRL